MIVIPNPIAIRMITIHHRDTESTEFFFVAYRFNTGTGKTISKIY